MRFITMGGRGRLVNAVLAPGSLEADAFGFGFVTTRVRAFERLVLALLVAAEVGRLLADRIRKSLLNNSSTRYPNMAVG